jgi:hypothetical protein
MKMVRDQEIYRLAGDNNNSEYVARRAQPGVYVLLKLASPREFLIVLGNRVVNPETLTEICDTDGLLQLQYPES